MNSDVGPLTIDWIESFLGAPFTNMGLTLIPTWICNHMHHKVWDEITYPFPNFNDAEVWEWKRNFMLGLKLIHVSKTIS